MTTVSECVDHGPTCPATADYIAARESESLSYGDLAYAQEQGWCGSSPDGMGPHRSDDTTDPVTCAECGATIDEIVCADSPTGQHVANPERFGDEVCVWCLEGPPDDGKTLIAGVLYDNETLMEADPQ